MIPRTPSLNLSGSAFLSGPARFAGFLLLAVFFLESGPLALAAELSRPQAAVGLLPGESPPAAVHSRQATPNKGVRNVEGPPRRFKLNQNPSLAEIQQARVGLCQMRAVGLPAAADRASVAQTLTAYEASGGAFDSKGAAILENYCRANPDSPFTPSLMQEKAAALQLNGRFGQALEAYEKAYLRVKDSTDPEAAAIRDNVLADYLRLLATLGRKEQLKALLGKLDAEKLDYYAAAAYRDTREISSYLDSRAEQNIQCGFHAINNVFEGTPGFKPLFPHVHDPVETEEFKKNGLSLYELKAHADESSHLMVIGKRPGAVSVPVPAVFHWKFGHYSALTDFKDGKYRLVDSYLRFDGWISPEVLAEEGSGYFVFPGQKLPTGFSGVTDKEAKSVFGRHCTHGRNGEGNQPTTCNGQKDPGMAGYAFQLLKAGLVIKDTPFVMRRPLVPGFH